MQKDIDALHKKQEEVRQRLAEMWQNGSDKWEEEKMRIDTALKNLGKDIEQAFTHAS